MRKLLTAVFLLLLLAAESAVAHRLPYAYLDIRFPDGRMKADLKIHTWEIAKELGVEESVFYQKSSLESAVPAILGRLRSQLLFKIDEKPLEYRLANIELVPSESMILFQLDSPVPPGSERMRIFCDLMCAVPNHSTYLKIYRGDGDSTPPIILNESRQEYEYNFGAYESKLKIMGEFIRQGIHHIFIGPDHIAFILGLVLLGGSLMRILQIVTSFTLAHSVTLSLAALNVVSIPTPVIELLVAFSIIYVGFENLAHDPTRPDRRALVAFLFGFVHGFGFANVLSEFGLPRSALWLSLLSFNAGVEIGQMGIVLLALPVFAFLRTRSAAIRLAGRKWTIDWIRAGSAGIAAAGGYWLLLSGSGWVRYAAGWLRL